jgi:hypothetical protein
MNTVEEDNWYKGNQRYLMAALDIVRISLERHARLSQVAPGVSQVDEIGLDGSSLDVGEDHTVAQKALREIADNMSDPPSLETLCRLFGLSSFERDVLLLCAGADLDSSFPHYCASASGSPHMDYPTFSLALAALPDAHWNALNPSAPLRYWRMIEMEPGNKLTLSPLRIDERILHYLAGVQYLDERLVELVKSVQRSDGLVPSHKSIVDRIVGVWCQAKNTSNLPVIQLCGSEIESRQAIATSACAIMGINLRQMSAHVIPTNPGEVGALVRLWNREAALSNSLLMLVCDGIDATDTARDSCVRQVIDGINGAMFIVGHQKRNLDGRPTITFDVKRPTPEEQRNIWRGLLSAKKDNLSGEIDSLVSQFSLSLPVMQAISSDVIAHTSEDQPSSAESIGPMLWNACRAYTSPKLDDLAQRIEPVAVWDDIVLPDMQIGILREVAMHVRQRMKVYKTWGFATKSSRGLGISALFAGPSGTGKTMASEVLANELQLDLYRIDLSSVVSKYIGETEKNLRRVFDAAEEGGVILLFDEADALFGKRSEVKDSHDRYANIEISYLLQRMEAYRGLAILTTNMKDALDDAFLRRIRFIVQFPFPDAKQREEIWQSIFPDETPIGRIDWPKLARLSVTGGSIRNIAMSAAFLAADAGEPVGMKHLLRATQVEYAKMARALTAAEIVGWV